MTTGKSIALTICIFVSKAKSLHFNILSQFVITFLPRSKFLISRLQSPSTLILEPKKINYNIVSTLTQSICHEVMWQDPMILVFWMLSFKTDFSLSSFNLIKRLYSFSSLSAIKLISSAIEVVDIFPGILDSSLWFIQPGISHDAICISVK